jgi:hypothetical protein
MDEKLKFDFGGIQNSFKKLTRSTSSRELKIEKIGERKGTVYVVRKEE